MKTWTTSVDCICGKKHSFYTDSEERPSGFYGYRCRAELKWMQEIRYGLKAIKSLKAQKKVIIHS